MKIPVSIRHLILLILLQIPLAAHATCSYIEPFSDGSTVRYQTDLPNGVSPLERKFLVHADGVDAEILRSITTPTYLCYHAVVSGTHVAIMDIHDPNDWKGGPGVRADFGY